jgi:hypothetical protein
MFCIEINLLMQFTESIAVCCDNRNVVGWGTMLQAGRSRARVPVRSFECFQFAETFQQHYGPGGRLNVNRKSTRDLNER